MNSEEVRCALEKSTLRIAAEGSASSDRRLVLGHGHGTIVAGSLSQQKQSVDERTYLPR
jgi:hypothetical protein